MSGFAVINATTLVLDRDNIDTDQIIPARFLTTTAANGLADCAFADWRFDASGRERPDSPFAERGEAAILVAGNNFGCGSSREHAAWALRDFGFRAVLSSEIADIFRANALKNGLLAVEVPRATHQWLLAHPGARLSIDLHALSIGFADGSQVAFELDGFSRHCLINGVDQFGYLLSCEREIRAFEATR